MRWITLIFGKISNSRSDGVKREEFDKTIAEYDAQFNQLRQAISEVQRSDGEEIERHAE